MCYVRGHLVYKQTFAFGNPYCAAAFFVTYLQVCLVGKLMRVSRYTSVNTLAFAG